LLLLDDTLAQGLHLLLVNVDLGQRLLEALRLGLDQFAEAVEHAHQIIDVLAQARITAHAIAEMNLWTRW